MCIGSSFAAMASAPARRWGRQREKKPWIKDREFIVCPKWCLNKQGRYSWCWADHKRATCFECGTSLFPGQDGGPKDLAGGKPAGKGKGSGGHSGRGAAAVGESVVEVAPLDDRQKVLKATELLKAAGIDGCDELLAKLRARAAPPDEAMPVGKAHKIAVGKLNAIEAQLEQKKGKKVALRVEFEQQDGQVDKEILDLTQQQQEVKAVVQKISEIHVPKDPADVVVVDESMAPIDVMTALDPKVIAAADKAKEALLKKASTYKASKKGSKSGGSRFNPLGDKAPEDEEDLVEEDEDTAKKLQALEQLKQEYVETTQRSADIVDMIFGSNPEEAKAEVAPGGSCG